MRLRTVLNHLTVVPSKAVKGLGKVSKNQKCRQAEVLWFRLG
jgi:hypothetical protein